MRDWRGFGQLAFALDAAVFPSPSPGAAGRSRPQLVVQFYEAGGEVWRYRTPLPDTDGDTVAIPLGAVALGGALGRSDGCESATWSANRDLRPDMEAVTRLGPFVDHNGPATGEVAIGPIRY